MSHGWQSSIANASLACTVHIIVSTFGGQSGRWPADAMLVQLHNSCLSSAWYRTNGKPCECARETVCWLGGPPWHKKPSSLGPRPRPEPRIPIIVFFVKMELTQLSTFAGVRSWTKFLDKRMLPLVIWQFFWQRYYKSFVTKSNIFKIFYIFKKYSSR